MPEKCMQPECYYRARCWVYETCPSCHGVGLPPEVVQKFWSGLGTARGQRLLKLGRELNPCEVCEGTGCEAYHPVDAACPR
jgi:hypothetical protein